MREIEVSQGRVVQCEEQFHLENDAGAVVWDSALVLAHFLIHSQGQADEAGRGRVLGKAVLELGAGTGLVGLVACALGAHPVVLTDLPHLVPYLESNIKLNDMQASASALPLEWGNAAHISSVLKVFAHRQRDRDEGAAASASTSGNNDSLRYPDLILGSDLLYKADELESLFFSLAVLSGPQTRVVLAHELRPGAEALHDVAQAHGFAEEQVPLECLHPDWRTDDIAVYVLRKRS